MNYKEQPLHSYPEDIRFNLITGLGRYKFAERINNLSKERVLLTKNFYEKALEGCGDGIMKGTAYSLAFSIIYNLAPRNEILHPLFATGIVAGAFLGAMSVYSGSACKDALKIIDEKLRKTC